jgi:hypothetical protein
MEKNNIRQAELYGCFATLPFGSDNDGKKETIDSPKLPLASSFIRKTLYEIAPHKRLIDQEKLK